MVTAMLPTAHLALLERTIHVKEAPVWRPARPAWPEPTVWNAKIPARAVQLEPTIRRLEALLQPPAFPALLEPTIRRLEAPHQLPAFSAPPQHTTVPPVHPFAQLVQLERTIRRLEGVPPASLAQLEHTAT